MNKSLLEHAFDFVSDKGSPVAFASLWEYVVKTADLSEEVAKERLPRFYTNLLLDGRFVALENNIWDLKSRQKFNEKNETLMASVSSEEESRNDDAEEVKERQAEEGDVTIKDDSEDDSDLDDGDR